MSTPSWQSTVDVHARVRGLNADQAYAEEGEVDILAWMLGIAAVLLLLSAWHLRRKNRRGARRRAEDREAAIQRRREQDAKAALEASNQFTLRRRPVEPPPRDPAAFPVPVAGARFLLLHPVPGGPVMPARSSGADEEQFGFSLDDPAQIPPETAFLGEERSPGEATLWLLDISPDSVEGRWIGRPRAGQPPLVLGPEDVVPLVHSDFRGQLIGPGAKHASESARILELGLQSGVLLTAERVEHPAPHRFALLVGGGEPPIEFRVRSLVREERGLAMGLVAASEADRLRLARAMLCSVEPVSLESPETGSGEALNFRSHKSPAPDTAGLPFGRAPDS